MVLSRMSSLPRAQVEVVEMVKMLGIVAIVLAMVVAGDVVETLWVDVRRFVWLHDLLLVLWQDRGLGGLGGLGWALRFDIFLLGRGWNVMVWDIMAKHSGYVVDVRMVHVGKLMGIEVVPVSWSVDVIIDHIERDRGIVVESLKRGPVVLVLGIMVHIAWRE